ncbi:U-box domain-containing protein [Vigna angularis]|uniref:U-box domain-containing protein n=1 Tax=Phaseolus angularis TaxID=3914 RepID=A0A8T0LDP8_PHAAN|nr:U-box domain-containing protein [Vigna angularis]
MTPRDRRILSFPAVHPCGDISPPTLLASLITLSQSVCNFQPELFPTQRRNARETIRQIGILLVLLQEIRDRGLSIPHSTILCLAELHFALQKINFLMQDCTLQGARLLMLSKSQHVASQFRCLIRAVATSLDVLPLQEFDVCAEVRELAELVTRQARKAKFEVDPSDARACKTLHNVLRLFARGTEPDLSSMQGIIDYLQIRTWMDCNKEISFLEEEISLECRDRDEREVPLLSSLQQKAAYEIRVLARTSIFNRSCLIEVGAVPPLLELLASASNDKPTQENAISALLKLSKHPNGPKNIITSGGLNVILSVLKNGVSLEIRQVAAAIMFYLSSVKEYRKIIGENPEVIPALVELVKEGTTCGRKNAVVAIFGLLLLPRNHQRVVAAGAVPALLDILASSDKEELVTEALAVLAALAENADGARAILEGSALALITGMLRSVTSNVGKEHSASILLSLCVNIGAEVVAVLAKDPSVMPSLYSLVTGGSSQGAKKARFLIKVIQDFHETRTSGLKGSSPPQERSLHVW